MKDNVEANVLKSSVKFLVTTVRPQFHPSFVIKDYSLKNKFSVFHYKLDVVSANAGMHQDVQ